MTKQIGWYIVDKDKEFRNDFECAAWYEDVLVKKGKYPLEIDEGIDDEGRLTGRWIWVKMPGTIIRDEFGSRFCGVPISDYDNYKNKGNKSSYTIQTYPFFVAEAVINKSKKYELFNDYEAREKEFMYDGEIHKTHGIYRKKVG